MTATAVRKATCPGCRRTVTVKKDGNLRHHKPFLGGVPWEDYCCAGSGSLPLEDRNDPHRPDLGGDAS